MEKNSSLGFATCSRVYGRVQVGFGHSWKIDRVWSQIENGHLEDFVG